MTFFEGYTTQGTYSADIFCWIANFWQFFCLISPFWLIGFGKYCGLIRPWPWGLGLTKLSRLLSHEYIMKMSLLPDVLARFCIRQQLVYDAVNKLSYLLYKSGPTPVSCVYVMKLIKSLTVVLAILSTYVYQLYLLSVVLTRSYVRLSIIFF